MIVKFRTAALAAVLLASSAAQAQTYTTSFEAPAFMPGDVLGQDGWGHLSNSPTRGAIEALPPGAPAALGAQGLAIRTRDVAFIGVSNHLYSPIISPPAGETGATIEGVVQPVTNDYFVASFWYRTPTAPLVSTRADGRFAELNPSTKGPDAANPANRHAQVRLRNVPNNAGGLVTVELGWYTQGAGPFTVANAATGLAWGEWYRFEYAIRTVDGLDGTAPNDLFTLRIFDRNGVLLSAADASTCASTWETAYKTGSFGGGSAPRGINGFDFWSQTGPNDTLVGHVDGIEFSSVSMPDPALQITSGNNQQAFTGSPLPAPLAVAVTNAPADHARCYPVAYAVQSTPPGAVGASVGSPTATPDATTGAAASSATLGDLAGTYTFSATSPALAGSPVVFTAEALALAPALDVQKALTSAPPYLVAGSVLGYTITATNTGNVALTGVTVSDPLLDTPNTACANVAVNATCVLTGNYTITAADVQAGTISNTATADSNETAAVQDTLATPIARADLAITKADSGADFLPGGTIAYTLTVSNIGPDGAELLQVTDTLPAGVQFVSATGAGWACNFNAGTVTCTRPALASGTQAAIALVVSVDAGYSGASIVNQASVSNAVADPVAANNFASETTQAAQPGLAIQKVLSNSPQYRVAGSVLAYTVTATNTGNIALTGVTVSDPALSTPNAACAVVAPNATCVLSGNYTITAADVQAGAVSNTATADSIETAPVQATLVTPIARADLALAKGDGGIDFVPGGAIDYTLGVSNLGPDAAETIQLTDTLPTGVQFVSASGTGWNCVFAAGTVTCTRATLAAGAQATVIVSVDVAAGFAGASITNQASVGNAVADPVPANNTASITTDAVQGGGPADLRVTKTASAAQVSPGATLTYTLTVTNVGVATALGTVLSDATPAGLVFLDATAPCAAGFPCALGDLANGASVVVMARYSVPSNYGAPTIDNTASAASTTPDPTPADNAATMGVVVIPNPPPPGPITAPAPIMVPAGGAAGQAMMALLMMLAGAFAMRRSGYARRR